MRKVQILGAGWDFGIIPPLDPSAEQWGTNNVMHVRLGPDYTGWTRWFDLHPTEHIQKRRPQAYEWYTRQPADKPVYRWEPDPAVPGCVVYPKAAVLDLFSRGQVEAERDFWGSLSWIIALAIYEQFDVIELFWFQLMNDQYTKQVPSTRYWIGQARGRGICCTIHGDSMLKHTGPLYGCEALSPPPEEWVASCRP